MRQGAKPPRSVLGLVAMIFISYRNLDANDPVSRLNDALTSVFGKAAVFRDKNRLQGGTKWPKEIEENARTRRIMLVVIGPQWHSLTIPNGKLKGFPRLRDPKDWVRKEITIGLEAGNIVILVLLNGTLMPDRAWLANFKLGPLADQQGVSLRSDDFAHDLEKLIDLLCSHCSELASLKTAKAGTAISPQPPKVNPRDYLTVLEQKTGYIDIRGLAVGRERAHRFPIEDLFISLTTTQLPKSASGAGSDKRSAATAEKDAQLQESRAVPLQDALQQDRLIIIGDPGAGKTTFLHRVAHALCQTELGEPHNAAQDRLGIQNRTFPIFIEVDQLAGHISRTNHKVAQPCDDDAPGWLVHYLAASNVDWGLDEEFFLERLRSGSCTVMLDGLDETPNEPMRKRIVRLLERAVVTYRGCRFVVTSRPPAYTGEVMLPGFAQAQIDSLSDPAIDTFLLRWCEAVYAGSPDLAKEHQGELLKALRMRPAIRRMARNPVMLTALAVLHWNERRLPEQRGELYESIIGWLARAKEEKKEKSGRETPERTLELLSELALSMQRDSEGLKVQVSKRDAAERLAKEWVCGREVHKHVAAAEAFLTAEELDSGIIVARGSNLQFWHRTFQEFLAARAIAGRLEDEQREILQGGSPPRLFDPGWLEVILLLAGILHSQGRKKVDNLVKTALKTLGRNPDLADKARAVGLIGAIVRDLIPLQYQPLSSEFETLRQDVHAIFDRVQAKAAPLETRIAAADALGQSVNYWLSVLHPKYWITIPAGKFWMGAQDDDKGAQNYDKEAFASESPVHEVDLDEYRLARYPVTVGQYQEFIEDNGYTDRSYWKAGGFGSSTEPEQWDKQLLYLARPVIGVSWYEAMAFCAWAGARLPTEAQWERAARGKQGRKFPWGAEPATPALLNYDSESGPTVGHPTPVGIYPSGATEDGICDMAGNVWEWCADSQRDYRGEPVSNPEGSLAATYRVIRGGSWVDGARLCRSADREALVPTDRGGDLGFRLAAVPHGKQAAQEDSSESAAPRAEADGL
jgi:formylglycine-generating enzyme required for sulfatase activity